MADAPQEYTLVEVDQNKVRLEGYPDFIDVSPPKNQSLPALAPGQVVRGWFNAQGKFGPYLKLAAERSQNGSSGAGRSDATGRSIERQVAAKIAGEILTPHYKPEVTLNDFAERFCALTDIVHGAIQGEPAGQTADSAVHF